MDNQTVSDDLKKLQEETQRFQNAIQAESVTLERDGIKLVIRGDQQISELVINGTSNPNLIEILNEALKKTQEIAAIKLAEISNQK